MLQNDANIRTFQNVEHVIQQICSDADRYYFSIIISYNFVDLEHLRQMRLMRSRLPPRKPQHVRAHFLTPLVVNVFLLSETVVRLDVAYSQITDQSRSKIKRNFSQAPDAVYPAFG